MSSKHNFGLDPFKKYRGWSNLGSEISNIYLNYPSAILVTDDRRVMAEALYYMKNKSLWLDLKILVKTIPAVLFREGAY